MIFSTFKSRAFPSAIAVIFAAFLGSETAPAASKEFRHDFGEIRQYHQHWLRVCPEKGDRLCRAVSYTRTSDDGFFLEGRVSVEQTKHGFAFRLMDETAPATAKAGQSTNYVLEFSNEARISISLWSTNVVFEREAGSSGAVNALLPYMKATNWMRVWRADAPESAQTYSLIGFTAALRAMERARGQQSAPASKTRSRQRRVHKSVGWPGEYPAGFTVKSTHKRLLYARPSFYARRTIPCTFKAGATYHVWNAARVKAENLQFVAFTEITRWRTKTAVTVDVYMSEGGTPVSLPAGTEWLSIKFLSEGYHVLEHDGVQYIANHTLLQSSVKIAGPERPATALWLGRRCTNGTVGWLPIQEWMSDDRYGRPKIIKYGAAQDR